MFRIALLSAVLAVFGACGANAKTFALERGLAITEPEVLERLEKRGFSLTAFFDPDWRLGAATPAGSARQLSARPEMQEVMRRVAGAVKLTEDENPGSGVNIAKFHTKRLFDVAFLSAPDARFALVGIVQRLDRAYKQVETCGEVRLIYRLEYRRTTATGIVMSRLPMTFNLVLNARRPGDRVNCPEIARRWIAAGDTTRTGDALVAFLLSDAGPLSLVSPAHIHRLETNLQTLRRPVRADDRTIRFGGHAEYVLRVFDWSAEKREFRTGLLENMIDRDKLKKNPALLAEFKNWLFMSDTVRKLDDGTLVIADRFLANRGSSFAPGGLARSGNQPYYGLFNSAELTAAIAGADQPAGTLKNIRSPAGFLMRLNDTTCVGCHQSRAIGGFHFMGADTAESKKYLAENANFVPASAHFYGEAPRRRRILDAMAADKTPNFARGYSLRPSPLQLDDRTIAPTMNLRGTGFYNGWSAACYVHVNNDASFKDWRCKAGLKCAVTHDAPGDPGHGACMVDRDFAVGDAAELGRIRSANFRDDDFERLKPPKDKDLSKSLGFDGRPRWAAPQSGGFFGGMMYLAKCARPMPSSSICAHHAATDFNSCLAKREKFIKCFRPPHAELVGLRECDKSMPCRDDYMCVATSDRTSGACLPPYFMMQFRVDGHPP